MGRVAKAREAYARGCGPIPENQIQETAISAQFVPGMLFLCLPSGCIRRRACYAMPGTELA
eukprot:1721851-Rhodomonas_salina.1